MCPQESPLAGDKVEQQAHRRIDIDHWGHVLERIGRATGVLGIDAVLGKQVRASTRAGNRIFLDPVHFLAPRWSRRNVISTEGK